MKNRTLLIVSLIIVLTATGIILYFISPGEKEISWRENYRPDNKEPYGTFVVAELMKTYFPGKEFEMMNSPLSRSRLSDHKTGHGIYVLIGYAMRQQDKDLDTLLSFIAEGNQAFIATRVAPEYLLGRVYGDDCGYLSEYSSLSDSVKYFNFYHPSLEADSNYRFDYFFKSPWSEPEREYDWMMMSGNVFCDSSYSQLTRLGYIRTNGDSGYVNFMKVPYGKGEIYFHSNPIVFTNYALKNERALEYSGKVFSHLEPGTVFWDRYSGTFQNDEGQGKEGPLKYILSRSGLRWAFYVLLGMVIIYIFIQSKRKQKAIPVLEPNENTSLDFIHTIGMLYYQNHDHQKICLMKMKQFLSFVRDRYFLQTTAPDAELITKISLKSCVEKSLVNEIFRIFRQFENTVIEITDQELAQFHGALELFYKKCK